MTIEPDGHQEIEETENVEAQTADDESAAANAASVTFSGNFETAGNAGNSPVQTVHAEDSLATEQGSTPHRERPAGDGSYSADDPFDQSHPIGRYLVRHMLGQGTFGKVYAAHDPQLDRLVAIKVSKEVLGPDAVNRFQREARSAAHLRHPNIIPVYEYGQIGDLSMIVYELVDGETLRSYIKRQAPLPLPVTVEIIRKIAEGLHYAHRQGIVHRDVKPDNVLIDKQGEPHIADFGCARRFDEQDMQQTMEGSILGTPVYMSPEQASGHAHRADGRTDVWSLGVMLYEMVAGEKPFQGKLSDLLYSIRNQDAKPLRKVKPAAPRDIETICGRCLRRELDQRFATAGDLADELERYQRGEPILSRRVSLATRTWLWAKRNRAVAGLLSAVAVSLLLGTSIAGSFAYKASIAQQARAKGLLEQLTNAESESLENVLAGLEESRNNLRDIDRILLAMPDMEERQRRRLNLGKIHLEKTGEKKRDNLLENGLVLADMLASDGHELLAFCRSLSTEEQKEMIPELWEVAIDISKENGRRLRALCALAQLDPKSVKWEESEMGEETGLGKETSIASDLAGFLTAMDIAENQQWLQAIEPICEKIKPELQIVFDRPRTLDDASPETAAMILSKLLANYDADRNGDGQLSTGENELAQKKLEGLVGLFPKADGRQLAQLMATLESPNYHDRAKTVMIDRLKVLDRTQSGNDEQDLDDVPEKANLILALIRLGHPPAWQMLKRSEDNSVCTEVIELMGPASTSVDMLLRKIDEELAKAPGDSDADALAVVLLALGQFGNGQIPETRREDIFEKQLVEIFKTHGDSRVHSAARWLMTHWDFEERALQIEQEELRTEFPEPGKNWHVDLSGNTFMVFEPSELEMQRVGKSQHLHRIPPRFGICIHETRIDEYMLFVAEMLVRARKKRQEEFERIGIFDSDDEIAIKKLNVKSGYYKRKLDEMSEICEENPRLPVTNIDFFKALAYCRWLTDDKSLPPSLPTIDRLDLFDEDRMGNGFVKLDQTGYRLPTAAEWEFACRAGTRTKRPFGLSNDRLHQYAWFVSNSNSSTQTVAELKPNEAGLFDMLGNVREWCLDFYYDEDSREDSGVREYRGGSYEDEAKNMTTSSRGGTLAINGYTNLGFRIARTYPPADTSAPNVEVGVDQSPAVEAAEKQK